jgi:cytosine/adenosine deaminase-related metal-dependent hydrolase
MSSASDDVLTVGARWILPVSRSPLENGMVVIQGNRIVSVEPLSQKRPDFYFEDAAITPGFVNAHTHLDLTGLRGCCPAKDDFTDWLRDVIRHRRERSSEAVTADIALGVAESIACGTTLLGDISSGGLSWPILTSAPVRSVIFLELLGLTKERSAEAQEAASSWLQRQGGAINRCIPGLSPHAPYSVHVELFAKAADLANRYDLPLAIHLAESREELRLLSRHDGPFVPFLQGLGAWNPEGLIESPQAVIKLCQGARTLLIHGNYLERSLELPPNHTDVYCPRIHAAFGHETHPFRELLQHGVRVALGTDSLASNPDLNLFSEARFLHHSFPDLGGDLLLRMATLSGAEAFGLDKETGSLEPGKSADLAVMPLNGHPRADPHEWLLESEGLPKAVMCDGWWVHLPS